MLPFVFNGLFSSILNSVTDSVVFTAQFYSELLTALPPWSVSYTFSGILPQKTSRHFQIMDESLTRCRLSACAVRNKSPIIARMPEKVANNSYATCSPGFFILRGSGTELSLALQRPVCRLLRKATWFQCQSKNNFSGLSAGWF